jgi:hypothetical protein
MKSGKYVGIPEGPADHERLWREAQPLDPTDLPAWVWREHIGRYRYLASVSLADLRPRERRELLAELAELEAAGLIIDEDEVDRSLRRVYVPVSLEDETWSIGIYTGESPLELRSPNGLENPVLTAKDVTDAPAAGVADPFMVRANHHWYMFFEVVNKSTERGEIGLAVSENGVSWSYQQIVLAEPFHLSYPYVFEWLGDYYMIPERFESGSIGLYKASSFPTRWSCTGTLLQGPYFVDNSIIRHDDKWWLFTETNPDVRRDTLRLFHADHLLGPWQEHIHSPIINGDPGRARPGGRMVVLDDVVIRYAQNCQSRYGTDVRAFAITDLTTTAYREQEVDQSPVLMPSGTGWNACGMHHIDPHQLGDGRWIACVDGWSFPGCL